MARNRVIYQSEALFAGPISGVTTGAGNVPAATGTIKQLERVQSCNYSFTVNRQDVNQFGQLAAIDRVVLEQPTVNLDFTYYLNTGRNENLLGLVVNPTGTASPQGALSKIMQGTGDVQNYYILVSPEGTDANLDEATATGQGKTIGLGNGYVGSYSIEAAVGAFPTATVNVAAYNMRFYGATSGEVPTISQVDGKNLTQEDRFFRLSGLSSGAGYTALKPGDVTFNISGATGVAISDLKVQTIGINFDIGREDLQKLGNRFAFAKVITFPLTATMTVDAVLGEIEAANLADLINSDCSKYNLDVTLKGAACGATTNKQAMKYTFKGAKLDSQEFTSSIGANKAVTLTFSSQIGGPTDSGNGVFIEGPES